MQLILNYVYWLFLGGLSFDFEFIKDFLSDFFKSFVYWMILSIFNLQDRPISINLYSNIQIQNYVTIRMNKTRVEMAFSIQQDESNNHKSSNFCIDRQKLIVHRQNWPGESINDTKPHNQHLFDLFYLEYFRWTFCFVGELHSLSKVTL